VDINDNDFVPSLQHPTKLNNCVNNFVFVFIDFIITYSKMCVVIFIIIIYTRGCMHNFGRVDVCFDVLKSVQLKRTFAKTFFLLIIKSIISIPG